eukprot:TRINITY_DN15545_c0_g1_i2.p1 TRINITY_DN15545_c0_g1~~TRINITY_DN15545_c0_g1_i2.p1  ORF type:complete len:364 (-),score=31.51 TRINITY_DN15545_c0_g1_i2:466-1557(-)
MFRLFEHKTWLDEHDAGTPMPDGGVPLRLYTVLPPGGLLMQLFLMFVDIPLDAYQVVGMFRRRQFFFGGCLALVLVITLCLQWGADESRRSMDGFMGICENSLHQGCKDHRLASMFRVEQMLEGFASALIASYALSLSTSLAWTDVVIALVSFSLSVKAVGQAMHEKHFEDPVAGPILAQRRMPMFKKLRQLSIFLMVAGFFASFAIYCRVLHPVVVLSVQMLCNLLMFAGIIREDFWQFVLLFLVPSSHWIERSDFFSVYRASKEQKPAGYRAWSIILKHTMLVPTVCCLSLPHGIMPFWTLGRPMGKEVFESKFLTPLLSARSMQMTPSEWSAFNFDRQTLPDETSQQAHPLYPRPHASRS